MSHRPASVSLVIATYNWPAALEVVLSSVRSQRLLPDEVVVADDGSGPHTRLVIMSQQADFPVPLRHVWHEDRGFRLAAIRNRAIERAIGEYLIQVDGDMVLHPRFVEAHIAYARRGTYVQGSRCMVSEALTTQVLRQRRARIALLERGLKNRQNALYLPWLSALVRGPTDPDQRTRGCHMAFWRDDLLRVNGYDEAFEGWGREDSELAARLIHGGVRRRNFKFAAIAYHLHHAQRSRASFPANDARYFETVRWRRTWCEQGIVRRSPRVEAALAV